MCVNVHIQLSQTVSLLSVHSTNWCCGESKVYKTLWTTVAVLEALITEILILQKNQTLALIGQKLR
jgi:hypothetical protein